MNFRRARVSKETAATKATSLRACGAVFGSLVCAGCLDSTPQYSVPDLIPPVVTVSAVSPPTSGIQPLTTSETLFTIPFRSDDLGEDLFATFVFDFNPENTSTTTGVLTQFPVPADPRPFSQQTQRVVRWQWSQIDPSLNGCHTITMILSHRGNYTGGYGTSHAEDVAQLTWVFDIENTSDPEALSHLVIDCPLNAGSNPTTTH